MRFLLFSIALILVALAAIYYSDLTDTDIHDAIQLESRKLDKQTKQARKQADQAIEAVNERLRGLREEYARIRREANKASSSGQEDLADRTEKTEKAAEELREKIARLSEEARTQLQVQAHYLQDQVKAFKEKIEREMDNRAADGKSR